ncbi:hypothetical protein BD410DRAFT_806425 [Rickenella mellea]|uniref:Uncharacterized protein n=1 Tax=Rickenella mellea TaxID=50990 RepID=A0A4Y7PTZ9_9AGAM|nr:hypothetical protein BD410DRAFT_806425 [Rickenella mellea]
MTHLAPYRNKPLPPLPNAPLIHNTGSATIRDSNPYENALNSTTGALVNHGYHPTVAGAMVQQSDIFPQTVVQHNIILASIPDADWFANVEGTVDELRRDVTWLKGKVADLREDVAALKTEIQQTIREERQIWETNQKIALNISKARAVNRQITPLLLPLPSPNGERIPNTVKFPSDIYEIICLNQHEITSLEVFYGLVVTSDSTLEHRRLDILRHFTFDA